VLQQLELELKLCLRDTAPPPAQQQPKKGHLMTGFYFFCAAAWAGRPFLDSSASLWVN
jgi:hypothetical protein